MEKRRMLKIEPIAADDNALEQLCEATARIEVGIGHINELLINVTAPSTPPAALMELLPLTVAIKQLTRMIGDAESKHANEIAMGIEGARRCRDLLLELRRRV